MVNAKVETNMRNAHVKAHDAADADRSFRATMPHPDALPPSRPGTWALAPHAPATCASPKPTRPVPNTHRRFVLARRPRQCLLSQRASVGKRV